MGKISPSSAKIQTAIAGIFYDLKGLNQVPTETDPLWSKFQDALAKRTAGFPTEQVAMVTNEIQGNFRHYHEAWQDGKLGVTSPRFGQS